MDPGGSIASVWPHPLPPASVPSFADNSTPNSSPPAPARASHLSISPLVLFSLSVPPPRDRFYHPCTHPTDTTHVYIHAHARAGGCDARGFITGVARGDVCSRARDVSVCVDVDARVRHVYVCTADTRGREGAAARGVTHFLAFHLFCLPTLFTPEPYFVNSPPRPPPPRRPVDARRFLRCESNGCRRFSCAHSFVPRRIASRRVASPSGIRRRGPTVDESR